MLVYTHREKMAILSVLCTACVQNCVVLLVLLVLLLHNDATTAVSVSWMCLETEVTEGFLAEHQQSQRLRVDLLVDCPTPKPHTMLAPKEL